MKTKNENTTTTQSEDVTTSLQKESNKDLSSKMREETGDNTLVSAEVVSEDGVNLEYEGAETTPFFIMRDIRNPEEWTVNMGKYCLQDSIKTREEAIKQAQTVTWDRIMSIIGLVLDMRGMSKGNMQTLADINEARKEERNEQ